MADVEELVAIPSGIKQFKTKVDYGTIRSVCESINRDAVSRKMMPPLKRPRAEAHDLVGIARPTSLL